MKNLDETFSEFTRSLYNRAEAMKLLAALIIVLSFGCGSPTGRDRPVDADPGLSDGCAGLECAIVNCEKQGKPPTTLSGTVYAPNGSLALYGAQVYVPLLDPGPFPEGVQCSQCTDAFPGGALGNATSDQAGKFTISNVPSGNDIPLFITMGKWRRKVTIPKVEPCADNALPASLTSLPKNKSEGDLPKIAIATGAFDALECLVRKLGVSDSEFTPAGGSGAIQLFAINGAAATLAGDVFPVASSLWSDLEEMKKYDIALLSCEGDEYPENKPQEVMETMKAYADAGGRVFLSHFQNVWIAGNENDLTQGLPEWMPIATCDGQTQMIGDYTGMIDSVSNPKGDTFAQWMVNVQGSNIVGQIPIQDFRQTCTAMDTTKAERWVYMTMGATDYPQNFQFTTPIEVDAKERCGKVVFSDMHVAGDSMSKPNIPFPMGCSAAPLIPQEKALAFMFFDIATCVGPIF
ncbi:MAG: carboxypeptidase-like regulatory domain-containing protein [Kofleriaceae bacterium]